MQVTAAKGRSDHLQRTGDISGAESDRVQYEWSAATAAEAAAQKRLEETQVEHDAVADGVFVGDRYNDSPSSTLRETDTRRWAISYRQPMPPISPQHAIVCGTPTCAADRILLHPGPTA